MAMTEYRSNSHKNREAAAETKNEKKVEKVVSGKVTTKKNEGRRLTDLFISEDVGNVKEYLFMDILVPAVKSLISSVTRDGIDMLLYGRTGGKSGSGSKVSYRSYYSGNDRNDSRGYTPKSRFEYDDIIFDTRGDAERVRRGMLEAIEHYDFVTVGAMYDMAGLGDKTPYTAYDYGWHNIRNAEPVRVKDGYILKLPKALPLD